MRLLGLLLGVLATTWATDVLTMHNDNSRSGVNLSESALTQANVTSATFGRLYVRPVSGQIYAQPLYVSGVTINGGLHSVIYVATETDMVYCFDADDGTITAPYWAVSLGQPVPRPEVYTNNDTNIIPMVGVTSTPVIDKVNGVIYVEAITKEGTLSYAHRLHKLSLITGADVIAPVVITAAHFVAGRENQRPALCLANGNIYVCFTSYSDIIPYNGYVISYSATDLSKQSEFLSAPGAYGLNDYGAGIWQSGCGPGVDAKGNIYVVTGNGTSDTTATSGTNFGESVLKLSPSLAVLDFFTPSTRVTLNNNDQDLGVGGHLLLPDQPYTNFPHLIICDSKTGQIYLMNRDNLGHWAGAAGPDNIVQPAITVGTNEVHATPIYWVGPGGPVIFSGDYGGGAPLRAFSMSTSPSATTPINTTAVAATTFNIALTQMSLTSNGSAGGTGIVWCYSPGPGDPEHGIVSGTLHAFNAETLVELYNSDQAAGGRDTLGNYAKFNEPTVVNGTVYAGTFSGQLCVYGLLTAALPAVAANGAPTNLMANATSPTQIALTWTNTATNLSGYHIDRALDNAFTASVTTISDTSLQPSYTDIGLTPNTTYYYRVRATNASGDSSNSNTASASTLVLSPLPSPWTNADVGAVGIAGGVTYSNGAFFQTGSGDDIWNNADAFNYTYQPNISGDFVLSARVPSLGGSDGWAKAGVMVRQSVTDAGAINLYMPLSYGNGFSNQYRNAAAGGSAQNGTAGSNPSPNNWVRIARSGGTLTSSVSADGLTWTQLGTPMNAGSTPALSFTDPVFVGLALTAHNNGLINPATFDHVCLTLGSGAPTITQIAPSGGAPNVATSITLTGTNFTGATALTVGGSPATAMMVVNATTITATTPALGAGPADVVLTTPSGTATLSGGYVYGLLPTISSLSVSTGTQAGGSPITITGTNFSGASLVSFGSVPAQILSISSTQIQATVPAQAPGSVNVTVTTPIGTSTSTATYTYTARPAPAITAVLPASGTTAGGTSITITGTALLNTTSIAIGGTAAIIGSITDTLVCATTPPGAAGPANVVVTTPAGVSAPASFTYIAPVAPTITTITPAGGPLAGGTTITINGSWFAGTTGVTIGGTVASIINVTNSTITCVTPPGAAGSANVVVTTGIGSSPVGTFTYFPVPTIGASPFNPASAGIGAVITITGTGFAGTTTVSFNGTNASTFSVNPAGTQITVTVPAGATTGSVMVTTPGGTATSAGTFTVTTPPPAPTVTSLAPSSGPVGSVVTITGTNLSGATVVSFNGTGAITFAVVSATSITATVPVGATTGTVSVTTPGGTATSAGTFSVTTPPPAPTVTSLAPTSGPVGTVVTITGTNLSGATVVSFNGTGAITFAVVSATSITATVPVGSTTGTVAVTTPGGTATSAGTFTVTTPPPAPTVASLAPTSGPVGTVVTITGTNLSGATVVSFSGTGAITFAVVSATSITATVPVGSTTGTVAVTTPGGTATSAGPFTVVPTSTITSVTPMSGGAGTVITIIGTNLGTATGVTIGGIALTNLTITATQITATVPSGVLSGAVVVATPAGSASSAAVFNAPAASSNSSRCGFGGLTAMIGLLLLMLRRRLR